MGCAESIGAANACIESSYGSFSDSAADSYSNSDSASGECCYEVGQQLHKCIGISTGDAQDNFFDMLENQLEATHCQGRFFELAPRFLCCSRPAARSATPPLH